MNGPELKPCQFCGDIPVSISRGMAGQPRWQHPNNDHCPISGYLLGGETFTEAWNRRTPDPAQIRTDALREAVKLPEIAAMVEYYKANRAVQRTGLFYATEEQFRRQSRAELDADEAISALDALIATPLSPTAVDGSPAPDAGGKEGV